ncbi:MAG: PIG-L family deacetylase [Promethearchaeota archaeon]
MSSKFQDITSKIIILSAHTDDVPLSLGGCLLGKLFKAQPTVIVVFSITNYIIGYDGSQSEQEVTRLRIKEENNAGRVANYKVKFLDFKDAFCRPNYSKYISLFQDNPIIEDPIYPIVKKELLKILVNHEGLICSPLSIGNHVDHKILTNIIKDLLLEKPELPILFYEDLPYADYIPYSKQEKIIQELNKITQLQPYFFTKFKINEKIKLLKIYQSQLDQKQLDMVFDYWDSIGKGERIWLTKAAYKLLYNTDINKW